MGVSWTTPRPPPLQPKLHLANLSDRTTNLTSLLSSPSPLSPMLTHNSPPLRPIFRLDPTEAARTEHHPAQLGPLTVPVLRTPVPCPKPLCLLPQSHRAVPVFTLGFLHTLLPLPAEAWPKAPIRRCALSPVQRQRRRWFSALQIVRLSGRPTFLTRACVKGLWV